MTFCWAVQSKIKLKHIYSNISHYQFTWWLNKNSQGKIESRKWFFKGFWEYMDPIYAQIIDCGSIPFWKSISMIIWHLESIPEVDGAWGEIEVILPEKKEDGSDICFVERTLLRSQYVEYKLSHYMNKAAESLYGFVSVLPGAFSIFRWRRIKGRLLNKFLKGPNGNFGEISKLISLSNPNKYLSEDRIMRLEIITKQDEDNVIHYVPDAKCLTDTSLKLTYLLKRRRRMFTSFYFSLYYVLQKRWRIRKRGKYPFEKFFFIWFSLFIWY